MNEMKLFDLIRLIGRLAPSPWQRDSAAFVQAEGQTAEEKRNVCSGSEQVQNVCIELKSQKNVSEALDRYFLLNGVLTDTVTIIEMNVRFNFRLKMPRRCVPLNMANYLIWQSSRPVTSHE